MASMLDKLLVDYGPDVAGYALIGQSKPSRPDRIRQALINAKMASSDGDPAFVLPYLAIGSAGAAYNKLGLVNAGITHVLALCGPNVALQYPEQFQYKRIAFDDVASSAEAFESHILDECLEYIASILSTALNNRNSDDIYDHKILVHCYQGKSRSAAVVTAHVAKVCKLNFSQAFERVLAVRPQAAINPSFVRVLRKLYGSSSIEGYSKCVAQISSADKVLVSESNICQAEEVIQEAVAPTPGNTGRSTNIVESFKHKQQYLQNHARFHQYESFDVSDSGSDSEEGSR